MKVLLQIICAIAALWCAAGCASIEGIPELASVRRLGIAARPPLLAENEHALRGTGGGLCEPVDIVGVSRLVVILAAAPSAAFLYSVTPASVAAMCRRIWVEEIGSARASEVEDTDVGMNSAQARMRALAARHGVDAILVVEPCVYAEVGRVTELDSSSSFGKDIPAGSVLLRTIVSYRIALFDAGTGRHAETPAAPMPEGVTCLFDLGPMTRRQLMVFLNTDRYAALFELALRQAARPLLPLFRSGARPRE